MNNISISTKKAITRYSAQERYKDRQKKLSSPKTEQTQKDVVTISSLAKKLFEEHAAKNVSNSEDSVPQVYTNAGAL